MAFFKSWKKEPPPPPPGTSDYEELYDGMRTEVLTPAGERLCTGRIRLHAGDRLDVLADPGEYLPRAKYNQPVILRCVPREGKPFSLIGVVGPNDRKFWRVEKLQYPQAPENRSFFRQPIDAEGYVRSTAGGQRFPCKLVDISGGGVRVVTEKLFQLESTFLLESTLLPTEDPFSITCMVKRIKVRPQASAKVKKFEYGCQFVDTPPSVQQRLLQVIFILQRRARQGEE